MAELVKHLNHPAPEVRRAAIHDLSAAEGDAVAMLIAALANAELKTQHAGVRDALVAMGKTSIPPLVAAVAADDASVAVQAIECLGRIKDREALDYLFGPALGQDAVRRDAAMTAIASIAGRKPAARNREAAGEGCGRVSRGRCDCRRTVAIKWRSGNGTPPNGR